MELEERLEFSQIPDPIEIEDENYMAFVKEQLKRRDIQTLLKPNNPIESTKRFYEGESIKWNLEYLEAWKLRPEITKGFTVLLKIRITDFRGAYRLYREGHGLLSWATSCPFCHSQTPEYAEHMIMICSKWCPQREEVFGKPFLIEPKEMALTSMVMGQHIDLMLQRTIPSLAETPARNILQLRIKMIEAKNEIDPAKDIRPWIIKVALFLDKIHFKRRKIIDQMTNPNPPPTTTKTKQTQLRITDMWSRG